MDRQCYFFVHIKNRKRIHCECSANGPETLKAMLRMENEIKRARAKNGRAVLILIVEGTPANYVTFLIQGVSQFLDPNLSQTFLHSKPCTRTCTRRLKCFVLDIQCSKTKHLRRLV